MLNSNPAGAPGFQNAEVYEQISWDGGAAGRIVPSCIRSVC
jgi:hypothetical protein